jgi:hypothetical protein
VKEFLLHKGESLNSGKHYTINEKNYINHTLTLTLKVTAITWFFYYAGSPAEGWGFCRDLISLYR